MGKTILTPNQRNFLKVIQTEKSITQNFYLTGGTALSEFHLHHRLSDDIDLFSELQEINPIPIESFLKRISHKLGVKTVQKIQYFGLFTFFLIYEDGRKLKIDFNYYPFPRIQKGSAYKNLSIDSIQDIAANKLHTIFMKPRGRDYIDLYCILQKQNMTIEKLILDAKAKFDWHIDPLTLASQFLRVKELKDYPKMLIPFDEERMEEFFIKETKKLKEKILK